jgi:ribosomal-protein-alanine N-acetyltransferase
MSVQVLSPAKNSLAKDLSLFAPEVVRLVPEWQVKLHLFFQDLKAYGDDFFFSPHLTDIDSIRGIASHDTKDMYYMLVDQGSILGYGMLRGWDEGYQIPSLGIAIHPSARNRGLGKLFMDILHLFASQRGAEKVRLRVHLDNELAINLYKSLGYTFDKDSKEPFFLIGFKNIER